MAKLRWALVAAASAAASVAAGPSGATTLGERVSQPILLSNNNLSWVAGQERWVTLSWTSQVDIEDVAITVSAKGNDVAVAYEDPSLGHAELAGGDDLAANEIDTVSFFLDPGNTVDEEFELDLLVDWTVHGESQSGTITLHVEMEQAGSDAFLLLTDGARVPAGGDGARNWVSLSFLGLRPGIGDFVVSIEGELPVYYPQRSFTSLHHDAELLEDERDVARFWLDPTTIEPGEYLLEVVVTYSIDGGTTQEKRRPLRILVD